MTAALAERPVPHDDLDAGNAEGVTDPKDLPPEAKECRRLRHAWPRDHFPGHRHLILIEPTKKFRGRVIHATRRMLCIGMCGTVRTEKWERGGDGKMHRVKKPTYKWTKPYRLRRADPDTPLVAFDADAAFNESLRVNFPEHKW